MRTACLTIIPAILTATCAVAQPAPSPADARAPMDYPSVAAALESIRTKSGAKITMQSGWTVIQDEATTTVWSFTPPSHPAYPAALRRSVVEQDGSLVVKSDAMCEAAKAACEQLMADVRDLDNRMSEAIEKKKREH